MPRNTARTPRDWLTAALDPAVPPQPITPEIEANLRVIRSKAMGARKER